MIAIVYSGSSFADWKLAEKGQIVCEFKTPGINPFFNDEKHIRQILNKTIELINYAEKIRKIYFFGQGASSLERKEIVTNAFSDFFRFAKVAVHNDLQAAALATCNDQPGIVGILGSGSNAACFDGKKVKPNNYGLGYVLGDEGSANWLGRQLLKMYLNENLPEKFAEKFRKRFDLDRKQILDRIYRQRQPTLFLSSFIDFLLEQQQDDFVKQLVSRGFDLYFKTYILPLHQQNPNLPISMVGSVAANFKEWLLLSAEKNGLNISAVLKEPIYNIINYYSKNTTK
ncbi:MAG TPA: hypothetical protein VEV16_07170 [Daejeonella sp.]|nr:hypothetical protein [Daejeonella sp.]